MADNNPRTPVSIAEEHRAGGGPLEVAVAGLVDSAAKLITQNFSIEKHTPSGLRPVGYNDVYNVIHERALSFPRETLAKESPTVLLESFLDAVQSVYDTAELSQHTAPKRVQDSGLEL